MPYQTVASHIGLATGKFNLTTDNIKICLINSPPNSDLTYYSSYNDIAAYEISLAGYTAGGQNLGAPTIPSAGSYPYDVTWPDVSWTFSAAGTATHVVIYDDTDPDKTILGYWQAASNFVLPIDTVKFTNIKLIFNR